MLRQGLAPRSISCSEREPGRDKWLVQILGSFLGPPPLFFLAWLTDVEEKFAVCCCWAKQLRAMALGASERHSGENVRRRAVEGAFIVVVMVGK